MWSYDQSFDPDFGARPNWVKDITVLHIHSIIVKGEAKYNRLDSTFDARRRSINCVKQLSDGTLSCLGHEKNHLQIEEILKIIVYQDTK